MPTWKTAKPKDKELTNQQTERLLFGGLSVLFGDGGFASEEDERKAWFKHRDELMELNKAPRWPAGDSAWSKETFLIPWAFWQYEAKEPRRLLKGRVRAIPEDGQGEPIWFTPEGFKETPPRRYWDNWGIPRRGYDPDLELWESPPWESQADYLDRHSITCE
jgi:hypothetical protein